MSVVQIWKAEYSQMSVLPAAGRNVPLLRYSHWWVHWPQVVHKYLKSIEELMLMNWLRSKLLKPREMNFLDEFLLTIWIALDCCGAFQPVLWLRSVEQNMFSKWCGPNCFREVLLNALKGRFWKDLKLSGISWITDSKMEKKKLNGFLYCSDDCVSVTAQTDSAFAWKGKNFLLTSNTNQHFYLLWQSNW